MNRGPRSGGALVLAAIVALPTALAGQDGSREPAPLAAVALDQFRLDAPPALALLGLPASAVTRPNTPRDLIASLVSGAGSDGMVPDGFALETAPYWLERHRGLELGEYYRASLADRLRYFTAISVATSRRDRQSDSVPPDAHAAIAIRTLLANGRPSAALRALGDSLRAGQLEYIERYRQWEAAESASSGLDAARRRLARQDDLLSSLTTRVLVGGETALRDSAMRTLARRDSLRAQVQRAEDAAALARRFETDLDGIESRLAGLARRYSREEIEPDGLILEIAAGTRARFERGEWSRRRSDGVAAWISPMYRIGPQGFEIIGLARYLSDVFDYGGRDLLDLGARAGIDIGKGAFFAEHSWRSLHGPSDLLPGSGSGLARDRTTRWSLGFDYPLGGKLWVAVSFGSDYRRADGKRPAIATIGVNLGFGAIELVPAGRR